jgi:hypothetical protein
MHGFVKPSALVAPRFALLVGRCVLIGVALSLVAPADAALGAHASTINVEQVRAAAKVQSFKMPDHTRYEMVMPNGASVHQFANAAGEIFAVTWSGPGKPDLRTLLGSHFGHLQEAGGTGRAHMLRQPAQVNHADIQIQTGGHMGYFWGVAYLPGLAPAGFSPSSLN